VDDNVKFCIADFRLQFDLPKFVCQFDYYNACSSIDGDI